MISVFNKLVNFPANLQFSELCFSFYVVIYSYVRVNVFTKFYAVHSYYFYRNLKGDVAARFC